MKTLYVLVTLLDQGECGTGFATVLDEPAQYLALFCMVSSMAVYVS